jgi:hypothetical protein
LPKQLSKQDEQAGDDLDALLGREVILGFGTTSAGKSYSTAKLIEQGVREGFNVVVIDRDRGLAKAIKEVFGGKKPDNLDYFLADKWDKIVKGIRHAFDVLDYGDWLVFEMVGRFWDFAQTEYSRQVYGEDLTNHILTLRAEAQQILKDTGLDIKSGDKKERTKANQVLSQKLGFSGLDGHNDWSLIKRMHNDEVFDRAVLEGRFHIFGTTSVKTPFRDDEKEKWPTLFRQFGRMPEGEKHHIHRFDTIAYLEQLVGRGGSERYVWRTELRGHHKDRGGRPGWKGIDFTGIGFIESYLDTVRDWEEGETIEEGEAEEE